MRECAPVLVRGVGDVGSAVAIALLRAGEAVAVHNEPEPTTPRRGMAFADAVFDGSATLDGILARRSDNAAELRSILSAETVVGVRPRRIAEGVLRALTSNRAPA